MPQRTQIATHNQCPEVVHTAFDPAEQALWSRPGFLVRRLNQIHYAMFFEECNYDITPVQYGVLTALALQPDNDQKTIGKELGLDRTTTADVLKRLALKGYVSRKVCPSDRRIRLSALTVSGYAILNQLHASMARAQQRLIAPLSPSDQKTFLRLLSQLVQANNHYGRAAAVL